MKKVITKTTYYVCHFCHRKHENKTNAKECELTCLQEKYKQQSRLIFNWHKKDDRYTQYCPICNVKIREYDSIWDGHRNNVGNLEFDISEKYFSPFYPTFPYLCCKNCISSIEFGNIVKKMNKLWIKYLTLKAKYENN